MELRQLRYLDAVARRRSFTQAALDLHVAQSALSQQVGRLERELGVELLRRTTRRVEVTEAGELVLARAPTWTPCRGWPGEGCASAACRRSVPCTPPR
jgi:LysR family transcriptional activator of glutamate synthase operon